MSIASATIVAGWLAVSTFNMVAPDQAAQKTEAELTHIAAEVQALKADSKLLKGEVATTANRIERRQAFLDALLTGEGTEENDLASLLPHSSDAPIAKDAARQGVLAPFAALEKKQMALVDRVAATAETRLQNAESLISKLGLRPGRFLSSSSTSRQLSGRLGNALGTGGPFVSANSRGADPRFTELYISWQRVEQIEKGMASLPAFIPTGDYRLSSSYGSRSDPFNHRAARHTGLDMAGHMGQDVYAAAKGRVIRAGWFGGYGNAIDIDHGHGIMTRYGHLSRIDVKVGDRVEIGEHIAAMGSTGRSTGPHLHYEIRIDGQAVDPLPFLQSSNYLLGYHKQQVGPLPTASERFGG